MTDQSNTPHTEDEAGSFTAVCIATAFTAIWLLFWLLNRSQSGQAWFIPYTLSQVAVISIVIWQVCEPFADAAQWVGNKLQLPGSIRGATLDAVASSMPELFTGVFFVVIALTQAAAAEYADAGAAAQATIEAGAEGFGATIATCAGSAVYNMILIPAFCALAISFSRPSRPTIDIDDEVVSRDGLWFLMCQILLIWFLFEDQMMWWMGVCLIAVYVVYIGLLYFDAKQHRTKTAFLHNYMLAHGSDGRVKDLMAMMRENRFRASAAMVMKAQQEFDAQRNGESDVQDDSAAAVFGYLNIPLNRLTVTGILMSCMLIAAGACYFLVEATIDTARVLEVPSFFIAVIVAAAASSVPDTFLALGAARRGDDSGAVSNAFGSNIFDICICLSIPLLVNSWMTGWQPVSLLQDGKPIPGLEGLRVLLVSLTIVNLIIMWHNRQITRTKAIVMCGLYVIFVGYAVLGSMGYLI
jgi:Ca2+/Na+ antiporter